MSDGTRTAVDGYEPVVAYRLMRADGTILAEDQPHEQFVPASTLKLAVLAAAARVLADGRLGLDQRIPAASTWPSHYDGSPFRFEGEEADPEWPTDQLSLPLRDILVRMIAYSSNEATNVVYDLVGQKNIARVFADAGCQRSALGRKYGDIRAAQHLGRASACTAGDLALLMSAVVAGRLVSQEWTHFMTDLLSRQQDRVIGAVVKETFGGATSWGSKSGWVPRIRHDVAFIGTPGPQSLALAVCTRDFPDYPSAVAAIRALTRGLLHGVPTPR